MGDVGRAINKSNQNPAGCPEDTGESEILIANTVSSSWLAPDPPAKHFLRLFCSSLFLFSELLGTLTVQTTFYN